jgi:hypothetical protein
MRSYYTPADPLLALRPHLSKAGFQNLVLFVLALSVARTFIGWRIAVAVILPIRVESAYQRLKRLLAWPDELWSKLKRTWLAWVLDHFATPGQPLHLLIDWTAHTDRCRSLWIQLVVGGGRSIPLTFWLANNQFGGPGKQRAFEDAALRQLHDWLPAGWPVVLIGDRGFGGRDRMRFVQGLGWWFLFRITGDARLRLPARGRRGRRPRHRYQRVDAQPPAPGQRWRKEGVTYGRSRPLVLNLVAVRLPAASPYPHAVWYLATNLPATVDVVAWYAERMQIEQSFRDYKSDLGLEQEYTRAPAARLQPLLTLLLLVVGRQIARGQPRRPPAAALADAPSASPEPGAAPSATGPQRYRVMSDWRRGWHELLPELVLEETVVRQTVAAAAAKARTLQQRPQVQNRRVVLPTKNRGRRTA